MALVDAEIKMQGNDNTWFTTNAAVVYAANIQIFHTDGRYKFTDGVTALSALPFLGSGSGTTPNLSQVLSEGYTANSSVILTDGATTELLLDPSYIQLKSTGLGSVFFDADAALDIVKYKGNELATVNDLTGFEVTSNKSTSVVTDQASNTKYPSVKSVYDWATGLFATIANKDATSGYAGLTLFKINFKNVANTFTSFFTNSNTAARTYTFQDRNGTIADDTDLAKKGNSQPIYSGKWRTIPYVGIPTTATGNQGSIFYIPYIVSSTHTVTDIGIEVSTAAIGSNVRLALYSDNNGVPGTLIEESGAIGANTLGLKTYTFASPIVLSASNQVYWMAMQASAAGIGLRATTTAVSNFYILGTGNSGSLYTQTQAFGAFPASATGTIFAASSSYVPVLKAQ